MIDLRTQVESSAQRLKDAWVGLSRTSAPGVSLSPKCYERWLQKAGLYRSLVGTVDLFPARDRAWESVKEIISRSNVEDDSHNIVRHGQHLMEFSIARHIVLTSYVAITWSIYDRLSNVCGRLAAIELLAENPKQNPRICEDFLALNKNNKCVLGFGAHFFLQQSYAWPLRVSYKMRNWLIHEGHEEGSVPLFKSDRISDEFTLHDDAISRLENVCGYKLNDGKIETCCLGSLDDPWLTKDLLEILEKYNSEIDVMFSGLVEWSVNSFTMQIVTFSKRDMSVLRSLPESS